MHDVSNFIILQQFRIVDHLQIWPKGNYITSYERQQSHEPEFDYLKSLEIEEKINKIRWLKRKNPAHFLLSTNGQCINLVFVLISLFKRSSAFPLPFSLRHSVKALVWHSFRFSDKTIKLWKVSERDKRAEGYNILQEDGTKRDPSSITTVRVRVVDAKFYFVLRSFPWLEAEKVPHEREVKITYGTFLGPSTQAHTCMSNVGPGQKLNLQGGWTYIHAFHSSNQSFGTFLTLKILNLHPELNLHPWLIHQCACVANPRNLPSFCQKMAPLSEQTSYVHCPLFESNFNSDTISQSSNEVWQCLVG